MLLLYSTEWVVLRRHHPLICLFLSVFITLLRLQSSPLTLSLILFLWEKGARAGWSEEEMTRSILLSGNAPSSLWRRRCLLPVLYKQLVRPHDWRIVADLTSQIRGPTQRVWQARHSWHTMDVGGVLIEIWRVVVEKEEDICFMMSRLSFWSWMSHSDKWVIPQRHLTTCSQWPCGSITSVFTPRVKTLWIKSMSNVYTFFFLERLGLITGKALWSMSSSLSLPSLSSPPKHKCWKYVLLMLHNIILTQDTSKHTLICILIVHIVLILVSFSGWRVLTF